MAEMHLFLYENASERGYGELQFKYRKDWTVI